MSSGVTVGERYSDDRYAAPLFNAVLPLAGRMLISVIFLAAGVGKIAAPTVTIGYIAAAGLPLPQVAYAIAVVLEVLGGILLVTGYHTRAAATALAVFCVVTALGFHHQLADQEPFIHFFKNLAITGGLLQIIAFGRGRYSVDTSKAMLTELLRFSNGR